MWIDTHYDSSYSESLGYLSYERQIELGVTYTFDFGRKIQNENELQIYDNTNSAIMKAKE